MPTSVAGILKLWPISLSNATGINSVVLKIKAANARVMIQIHWCDGLGDVVSEDDIDISQEI